MAAACPAGRPGPRLATLGAVSRLDWTVVRTAATGGLIIIVPGAFGAGVLLDGGPRAVAWFFLAVAVAGFALAGVIGGRLRTDTPILHGGVGAALAFVVAQAIGIALVLGRGDSVSWVAIPLTGLIAVAAGVAGALGNDAWHRRAERNERAASQSTT